MGDSGRKLLDTTRSLGGGLPEADPSLATDGHDITLTGIAGTVSPEYLSVMFDLTGGTSVEIRTWLYYPDVENVGNWQEVSVNTISDDITTANTFLVVPSMGATRAAFAVESEVGGVTDISYTIRSIDQEDAQIMVASGFGSPAIATDVNLIQVDGVAVSATGGIQDVAVTSIPETEVDLVKVGGVAVSAAAGIQDVAVTSIPETEVDITKVGGVAVSAAGGVQDVAVTSIPETEVDLVKIAGNAVAAGSKNGTIVSEGTIADDTADDGSFPNKIGAVTAQVPVATTNGKLVHIITDLERFLRTVPKSFDTLSYGDKTVNLNLDSNNHDYVAQQLANESNLTGPGTHYFPSSSGDILGDRYKRAWMVGLRDVDFEIEVSNDGTNWDDATASLIHCATGLMGYTTAYFTEPDAATIYFGLMFDQDAKWWKYRFKVTTGDNTNVFTLHSFGRA